MVRQVSIFKESRCRFGARNVIGTMTVLLEKFCSFDAAAIARTDIKVDAWHPRKVSSDVSIVFTHGQSSSTAQPPPVFGRAGHVTPSTLLQQTLCLLRTWPQPDTDNFQNGFFTSF